MTHSLTALSQPMTVKVVDGEVAIIGPDGVAVSLTPEAAEESARRLAEAAHDARDDNGVNLD